MGTPASSVRLFGLLRPHETRERLARHAAGAVPPMTLQRAGWAVGPAALFVHVERTRRVQGFLPAMLGPHADPLDERALHGSERPRASHVMRMHRAARAGDPLGLEDKDQPIGRID